MAHPCRTFLPLALSILILTPALKLSLAQIHESAASVPASNSSSSAAVRLSSTYGKLPLSFEINQGQTDGSVQFLARQAGYTLFLTPGEAVLSLHSSPPRATKPEMPAAGKQPTTPLTDVVRMQLIGANTRAQAAGVDPLPGKSNYFIGNDPAKWHTDVPTYAKVRYQGIYPGIDLLYYGNQEGRLEHDFVVAPGADPNAIVLSMRGSEGAVSEHSGGLTLHTKTGDLTLRSPVVYQEIKGERKTIPATYTLAGNNQIRFELGSYDRNAPLVIDPVLAYTAEFGGTGALNLANTIEIAVDSSGQTYFTGYTITNDFPTANPYQSTWTPSGTGPGAAFVAKINAAGTAFVYSTYLGGPATNNLGEIIGIAANNAGNAYVVGYTQGSGFPTTANAYQPTWVGSSADENGFLTVLSPQGDSLIYSTYFGGKANGVADDVALDPSGNIYVAGFSQGTGFPQLHSIAPEGAIFVAKFNSAWVLQYSTLFGTGPGLGPNALAVDAAGAAYITGTLGAFPGISVPITEHAYRRSCPTTAGYCAYVTKVDPTGAKLDYSTYLVGKTMTGGSAIAVDSSGEAYVGGVVGPNISGQPGGDTGFPITSHAFQKTYGGGDSDGFVTKLNATGTGIVWSTYVGGSGQDWVGSLALDQYRNVYVAGYTYSTNLRLKDPIYTSDQHMNNGFVTTLNGSLSDIAYYSTYFPVSGNTLLGLAVDPQLNVYLAGVVNGANLPVTPGSLDAGPGKTLFVSKLVIEDDLALGLSASPNPVATGGLLTYTIAVTSKGPDFGYNVRMSDPIPAGTTFVSYDAGGGKCTAPAVGGTGLFHCELLQLNKGDTWNVKLTVLVNAATGSTLSNTATTVSNTQDFTPSNNTGTITTPVD